MMDLLLTIEERRAIAGRCAIVQGLLQGELSQRDLAAELQVGIASITRGSNGLKQVSPALRDFLQQEWVDD